MKRFLFAGVALVALSCGRDPSGPAVLNRYVLVRLNGLPLPYVRLEEGDRKEEVIAGSIKLKVDGTFEDRATFRITDNGSRSNFDTVLQGPFARDENGITFTVISEDDPSGDDQYTGSFVADTLEIQVGATNWKYVER